MSTNDNKHNKQIIGDSLDFNQYLTNKGLNAITNNSSAENAVPNSMSLTTFLNMLITNVTNSSGIFHSN